MSDFHIPTEQELFELATEHSFWQQEQKSQILLNPKIPPNEQQQILKSVQQSPGRQLFEKDHFIVLSSGTSGRTKWVAISKQAVLANALSVVRHLSIGPKQSWGLAIPLFHVGGLGVLARAHLTDSKVILVSDSKWSPLKFLENIERNSIRWVSLVPTQLYDLLENPGLLTRARDVLSNLKGVIVGGAACPESLILKAEANSIPLILTYGMSEASSQIASSLPGQNARDLILLDIWSLKKEEDDCLLEGLALASFVLDLGPINKSFLLPDLIHWEKRKDGRVQVWPKGRRSEIVKILGELVSIGDIEQRFAQKLNLASVGICVIARDNNRRGKDLILCYEILGEEKGIPAKVEETFHKWNKEALGYEKLEKFVRLERFPRNDLGKIQKTQILLDSKA